MHKDIRNIELKKSLKGTSRNKYDTIGRFLLIGLIFSYIIPLNTSVLGVTIYPFDLILYPLILVWIVGFKEKKMIITMEALKINLILCIFVLWLMLTTIFSFDIYASLSNTLLWFRILIISIVISTTYEVWYDLSDVGWMAIILLMTQCSIAIIQFTTQTSFGQLNKYFGEEVALVSYRIIEGQYILRSQGTLGNPNTLGNWIIILLPLSQLNRYSTKHKIYYNIIFIFGLVTLITTLSRGTTLIFLTLIPVIALFYILYNKNHNINNIYIILIALAVACLLFIILVSLIGKLNLISDFLMSSARGRKILESINIIKNYPLLGTGIDAYRAGRDALNLQIGFRDIRVHNIPLLVISETGIIGGGIFMSFFIYYFKTIFGKFMEVHRYKLSNSRGYSQQLIKIRSFQLLIFIAVLFEILASMNIYTVHSTFQFLPIYLSALVSGICAVSSFKL